MQNIKYLIYIIGSFLLFSCSEDFFDSVTEVDIPEHEPQLVIKADFDPTFGKEYGYLAKLTHTLGILDTTEYELIEDATVTLLEEGTIIATFEPYGENGFYRADAMNLLAGKNYTLKADSPTYGSAESTQQLPTNVPIIAATYEADAAVDRYGDRGDEVTIQFQDPAGERNYYSVRVLATYPFVGEDTSFVVDRYWVYTSPVDPILEDLDQLYLNDASFDGAIYTTRIRMEELMEEGSIYYDGATNLSATKITVHLTSISKDRYLFQKTLSAYQDNDGNPFAEPVVIHENMEGGSGIFSMNLTNEFSIDL